MSNNSNGSGTALAAVERKEIERKRRQEMRRLCVKLASLLPKEQYSSRGTLSQLSSLDEAAAYIKKLKERVDELQQKRSSAAMRGGGAGASTSVPAATMTSGDAVSEEASADGAVAAPVVEVRQHNNDGSSLDVVLISSVERPFKIHEVVTVLEEEGAEIINANFSDTGQQIFYNIHCRVIFKGTHWIHF